MIVVLVCVVQSTAAVMPTEMVPAEQPPTRARRALRAVNRFALSVGGELAARAVVELVLRLLHKG
ncbi:hypothetical protein [Phaeacidiphilus oryzae]|uniref:hypothetical protein n=1 Tax=Phaeacidiphilus oryzae TaxID=348818 RepID=UPI0005613435|nr:hypothetical protein [Phaeacidiphilus oryzae]